MHDFGQFPDRWTEAQCRNIVHREGVEWLHTIGVPLNYTGFLQTKDAVPYSQKTLDRMTKKFSSASPEFAHRLKSNANYAHQNLAQRYPAYAAHGTRQSPPLPFESGPNTLPGMEAFKEQAS